MSRYLAASVLFVSSFFIYLLSPAHQIMDSHYSLLLSQNLIRNHTFQMDRYFQPPLDPKQYPGTSSGDYPMHVEKVNGHIYYFFPPGSSILSIPFVFVLNQFGISAERQDQYDSYGELMMQVPITAFVVACIVVTCFLICAEYVSLFSSVVISLIAAFGSQLWSTASRSLWSVSWETLLISLAILVLVKSVSGNSRTISRTGVPASSGKRTGFILATLLAWAYFTRPTAAVPIVAIGVFLLRERKQFWSYGLTLAAWGLIFSAYSYANFHRIVPSYYAGGRLAYDTFWIAFAANLVSPARGLLIYSPAVLFIPYLLIKNRKNDVFIWLALCAILLHLILISTFPHWWGGNSYGARFTTELVPWLVLLAAIGVAGYRWHAAEKVVLVLLLGFGFFAAGNGALNKTTMQWNAKYGEEPTPAQIWDWRDPQFLAH